LSVLCTVGRTTLRASGDSSPQHDMLTLLLPVSFAAEDAAHTRFFSGSTLQFRSIPPRYHHGPIYNSQKVPSQLNRIASGLDLAQGCATISRRQTPSTSSLEPL
jgi:hypothetical protein